MTKHDFERLYNRVDRMDDRLMWMCLFLFFIMIGVCDK